MLSITKGRYIRRRARGTYPARRRKDATPSGERRAGLGKVEELPTDRKRAVHERAAARLFPRQAAGLEGRDPLGIEDHLADSPGRERQSSRSRRPRIVGNRPGD